MSASVPSPEQKAAPPSSSFTANGKLKSITPRIVQIGLNLISLLDVNDKMHYFEGNVLMHIFWDAAPMNKTLPFFRPWIQLHNIKSIEEIQNSGMSSWTSKELAKKVKEEQQGDANVAVPVMETRNFVGQFISELDLRNFPFDHQSLRITVMANMTKDVTFTHKVPRNMDRTKNPQLDANPGKVKNPVTEEEEVICAIKCNLEADTLSEWDVRLQGNKTLDKNSVRIGNPAPAVVKYEFKEHDKAFSAEGAIYQRLDFHVYVKRELKNMMASIILPTVLLSLSAMSVFSLDILTTKGERLSVLFVVELAIISNMFSTQVRLPYLAYFTWLDLVLFLLQGFVYLVVIETAIIQSIAENVMGEPVETEGVGPVTDFVHYADLVGMYILFGIFGAIALYCSYTAWRAIATRDKELLAAEAEAKESYDREEKRLKSLWFPDEYDPPAPSKEDQEFEQRELSRRRSSAASKGNSARKTSRVTDQNPIVQQELIAGAQ